MTAQWHFRKAHPGDRARESQVEKFFSSDIVDDRANAIVREGIQNSLDATSAGQVTHVRIAVGSWSAEDTIARTPAYLGGIEPHLDAVRPDIPGLPTYGEGLRYLVFEDFGTPGLTGDPKQWWPDVNLPPNPFLFYFRAEGISEKHDTSRGRHGVGKHVFARASRIRSIFGLTVRSDNRTLLMGTTVLKSHRIEGQPYLPDGWFGLRDANEPELIVPIEYDEALFKRFSGEFGLLRTDDQGLSVVVPWLDNSVTYDSIVKAVIRGYFHPILRDLLIVDVSDETGQSVQITKAGIRNVAQTLDSNFFDQISPFLDLATASIEDHQLVHLAPPPLPNAPRWVPECVSEASGQSIAGALASGSVAAIRVPMTVRPKGSEPRETRFDIFLRRDESLPTGQLAFIREGIIVSDARHRRVSSIRGLIVIDDGPLASFLGDAENPSHTQWQKDLVKDKYLYAPAHIDYVVQSVPEILRLISAQQDKADPTVLIDLFSLPDADATRRQAPHVNLPTPTPGTVTIPPTGPPPPRPRRFSLSKIDGGFVIRKGAPESELPTTIDVRVAYDVRRGNPLAKYRPADFVLDAGPTHVHAEGVTILEKAENRLRFRVDSENFALRVTGFDSHRDLHIRARVVDLEAENAEAV